MNNLINFLDEILKEENAELSSRLLPKDKEIAFEYYSTNDKENNRYVKSVEITIENQKSIFSIPDLKAEPSQPIKEMALKGLVIVKKLNLDSLKKKPADLLVKDGKVISISGYTLEEPFSIYQIDNTFIEDLVKKGIIAKIIDKMKKEQ